MKMHTTGNLFDKAAFPDVWDGEAYDQYYQDGDYDCILRSEGLDADYMDMLPDDEKAELCREFF